MSDTNCSGSILATAGMVKAISTPAMVEWIPLMNTANQSSPADDQVGNRRVDAAPVEEHEQREQQRATPSHAQEIPDE